MIDLIKGALAFPIYFFSEIVPMLWNTGTGVIGEFLDKIDTTYKLIVLIPIAIGGAIRFIRYILTKDS